MVKDDLFEDWLYSYSVSLKEQFLDENEDAYMKFLEREFLDWKKSR